MSRIKATIKQLPIRGAIKKLQAFYQLRTYRTRVRWRTYWQFRRRYQAPVDPFKLLWVDPQSINEGLRLTRDEYMAMREQFDVKPGDWDLDTYDLTTHWVYRSFKAHFFEGVPWEETILYEMAVRKMRAGTWYYHGCTSIEELQLRLWEVDAFYARVETHGYKTQAELENTEGPLSQRRRRPPEFDEIIVSIGREGDVIFVDGIHRLTVAKLLNIREVPVCVLLRHEAWQNKREQLIRGERMPTQAELEHPDLMYLNLKAQAAKGSRPAENLSR